MTSLRLLLVCVSGIALSQAQIPWLGFCPDYVPMPDFDMSRFMGKWFEAERYFSFREVGSRCVVTNYARDSDQKLRVSNEVTNVLTGVRRIIDGELKFAGKAGEGKLTVKYTNPNLPVSSDNTFSVLDTDYDSYAVLFSCSSLGPINTQNAWVMTRERLAPGPVLQRAYGVLDKYKISRTFFVKTRQNDCIELENNAIEEKAKTVQGEAKHHHDSHHHGEPQQVPQKTHPKDISLVKSEDKESMEKPVEAIMKPTDTKMPVDEAKTPEESKPKPVEVMKPDEKPIDSSKKEEPIMAAATVDKKQEMVVMEEKPMPEHIEVKVHHDDHLDVNVKKDVHKKNKPVPVKPSDKV